MPELDELIERHYAAQRLPAARLDAILAATPRRQPAPRVWYRRMAAVAAGLLLCFGAFHVWMQERDATRRVLAEIAMNHQKQLEVEVAGAEFAAVARALDRIDFEIRPPEALRGAFELLGGRYCSIQGVLAAQLTLRDRGTGAMHTLYATGVTPALAGIGGVATVFDGVPIRLWHEGAVFFGLAGRDAVRAVSGPAP